MEKRRCWAVCFVTPATVLVQQYAVVRPPPLLISVPDAPPERTPLADFRWSEPRPVSQEELAAFRRDGYVVLRDRIDAGALDIMLNASERLCAAALEAWGLCVAHQARWQLDVFRDFWLHGPIGRLAHAFIGQTGVRVVREGMFAMRHDLRSVDFFSFKPHIDDQGRKDDEGGLYSVWGALPLNTSAVSTWFPLHDINPVAGEGSLSLWPGSERRGASVSRVDLAFRRGDVVFFHPLMAHQTQRIARRGWRRYAWYAWLAEADAVLCANSVTNGCNSANGEACCRGGSGLEPGARIHHACYPQVYPSTLEYERAAYFAPAPRPLVDPAGVIPRISWWAKECAV